MMNGTQNGFVAELSQDRARIKDDSRKKLEEYSDHWTAVMSTVFRLVLEKLNPDIMDNGKVLNFSQPKELMDQFDLALQDQSSIGLKEFTDLCQQIVQRSVKTSNPLFLNQLYGGMDAFGLAAAILTEALNTSAYTYDVAPLFSIMEKEVVDKLCGLCGFPGGSGISCPGGSLANMYGLNLARFQNDPEVKQKGLFQSKRLLILTSAQSHYSVKKGAAFMGFGTDSIISVACDSMGAMIPQDLEAKILASKSDKVSLPLVVWCTSGTTVLNAFDPLDRISAICVRHKIWMHVDACLGGGFLVSEKLKKKYFQGIERANSVSWNWHKLNGAPLQTSMFITPHKNLLAQAHSAAATYLFHAEKHYDVSFDSGDASIQCGRKPDAFKIWLMWKGRGLNQLAERMEDTCAVADYMAERLGSNSRFRLVMPQAQGSTVCFWVISPRIAKNFKKDSEEYWREIQSLALKLKSKMAKSGLSLITYQPLPDKGLVNFFRCTLTCHPPFTREHVENVIDVLVSLSDDL